MKILLSSADFFPNTFGGGQVYVYHLGKELQRRGKDIIIVTSGPCKRGSNDYSIENYEYDGLPVIEISLNPEAVLEEDRYSELSPILFRALNSILKEIKPDCVHLNGFKPALVRICNQLNIPYVLTAHHPGVACPNSTLLLPDESLCDQPANPKICIPCCSMWRASRSPLGYLLGRIPKWIYDKAGEIESKYKKVPYLIRTLRYPHLVEKAMEGDRVILDESRYIISPSKAIKELLVRNGVSPEKIILLPHGIHPLPRLEIEPFNGRPIRFGFVGSFGIAKGLHILIKALNRISSEKSCELNIYSGSSIKSGNDYFKKCISKYNGKVKIINNGYVSNEKIIDAYRNIDILIVPSIYLEVFGLIVLEAFSVGRPVIVSKSGGPEELVRDGIDGFVFERNDPESLARAMQKFIDNPNLIYKMSQNIKPVKTISEYVDEIEMLYHKILTH